MRRFFRADQGSVVTLAALMFPVLMMAAALTVDLGNLYYNKATLQRAADAAAIGAVLALPTSATVTSRALDLAGKNTPSSFGSIAANQDITIGTWDPATRTFAAGGTTPNAVEVRTHRTVANGNAISTYLTKFAGLSYLETNARALAIKYGGACVIILDGSASAALNISGSGQINMNCPLQVNSSSNAGARAGGSSTINTIYTCVTGGYSGNGWSPVPKTGCAALKDPLASIPEPAAPLTTCTAPSASGTISSGCTYTGKITLSGSLTLQGGLIYFKNAQVSVASNTTITGSGVTLFLDAGSTLNLGGGGDINLSAATSGVYAGILVFQSRSTPGNTTLSLGGGGSLALNGTLYAPSATISLSGSSSYSGKVGFLISNQLTLGGSTSFTFNAFPTSTAKPRSMLGHAGLAL